MIVKFNPYVNQNVNCRAVNQKYLKLAQKSFEGYGNISSKWSYSIRDDVCLWKGISKQDAIDTMLAVRKYVEEGSMDFYNHVLDSIKRAEV